MKELSLEKINSLRTSIHGVLEFLNQSELFRYLDIIQSDSDQQQRLVNHNLYIFVCFFHNIGSEFSLRSLDW